MSSTDNYGRFRTWLYSFIPRVISNRLMLGIMQFMRAMQRHGAFFAATHHDLNVKNLSVLMSEDISMRLSPFMENQKRLSSLYLGMSTMDRAGCEIIAVYNALRALGMDMPLPDLIERFEKDGMIYSGRYGVSAYAMRDALKDAGLKTVTAYKIADMGKILAESATSILTMYNDKTTIGAEIHSVCISRSHDGYLIHNMYGDGAVLGPYKDFDDMIGTLRGGKTGPILMIGVNPKQESELC